jgi:membrane protease YdiL (CAAX protease family)
VVIGGARGDWDIYRVAGVSTTWKLLLSPVIGVALGLLVVFLTRLSVHRFDWARRLHRDFRGLLGHLHARDVFILAVASSVGEELLFRGALQPWWGLLPAAGVFALLHIGPGLRFLSWTFSALVIGLVFGSLAAWLGDLGAPIAAHFVINFMNLDYITRVELPAE